MSKNSARNAAKKYGVDVDLLEINLSRSYTERVLELQNALALANRLQKAGAQYYTKLRKTHKSAQKKKKSSR